jgi:hypothetical protein
MDALAVLRDISLLYLISLTFLAVLPFVVLFFFCIKGLHRLRQLLKQYAPLVQDKARQVAEVVEQISQKIVSPFIAAHVAAARVSATLTTITRRKRP